MTKVATLEDTVNYNNNAVINKFLENFNVSFQEAEEIFTETKRWLWICAFSTEQKINKDYPLSSNLFIDSSMVMLDEMWHTFILFTKDYHVFCDKFFGFYLHHSPTTKREKEEHKRKIAKDKAAVIKESYEKSKSQYEYIYDLLGGEVLEKWYDTFAEKYSVNKIKSLRILH